MLLLYSAIIHVPQNHTACPTCQKVHKAPETAAGRKVHCLRCSQSIIVPVPVEIKNKPVVGLLLPEKATFEPSTAPNEEAIDHSFDDCITPSDSQPLDPPPVRLPPAPETRVNLGGTDPFGDLLQNDEREPYWVPPKPSIQGVISTIGAIVMILLILSFWGAIPIRAGPIARGIGISCALTGLIWAGLSFLPGNRRFWSISACITNIVLLLVAIFR